MDTLRALLGAIIVVILFGVIMVIIYWFSLIIFPLIVMAIVGLLVFVGLDAEFSMKNTKKDSDDLEFTFKKTT